jgi:hypothetical protein
LKINYQAFLGAYRHLDKMKKPPYRRAIKISQSSDGLWWVSDGLNDGLNLDTSSAVTGVTGFLYNIYRKI